MIPLESSISPGLKAKGFHKKSRTWWKTCEDTIQVLNLQKSPFGERLYINLGVYVRQLGHESNPAQHKCHISVRLENIAAEQYWRDIVSAESKPQPPAELIEAILSDGVAWLDQVSTMEGIRAYLQAGGDKKGMAFGSVRELIGAP